MPSVVRGNTVRAQGFKGLYDVGIARVGCFGECSVDVGPIQGLQAIVEALQRFNPTLLPRPSPEDADGMAQYSLIKDQDSLNHIGIPSMIEDMYLKSYTDPEYDL